jgi:hypothetical protein
VKTPLALLAAAVLAAPPSGRPPLEPLARLEPKVYDVTFEVSLTTWYQYDATQRAHYRLRDAPIVMPLIFQGTYHGIAPDTVTAALWLEGRPDPELPARFRIDDGYPHHGHLAVLPIVEFNGTHLRWHVKWRAQVYNSRLGSEEQAASRAWPRQWPQEVLDGLEPQMFIESKSPVFTAAVERASEGKLRLVPPYLAAKDLVRWSIGQVRVSGNGVNRGNMGVLHGLEINGALRAAQTGLGSPHDLVCVCVAMLRAAGIPARPVIGIEDRPALRGGSTLVSWAEFYLPEAGWVPFDPMEMRGKVRTLDVRRPWPEFGTMDELNERIPLAYHFVPPASVESPMNASIWGWDPRPGRDPGTEQQIRFTITSRGRGGPDPGQPE